MSEKTFQQKFGAFALVAAIFLLIVNLVVGATVLGITSPLLLGVTGLIMMRDDSGGSGGSRADDD